eukprot:4194412-Pyramimonas_sp.AAC.1
MQALLLGLLQNAPPCAALPAARLLRCTLLPEPGYPVTAESGKNSGLRRYDGTYGTRPGAEPGNPSNPGAGLEGDRPDEGSPPPDLDRPLPPLPWAPSDRFGVSALDGREHDGE